jgi:4-hydroxyphenylacetate 3-monooxygenase
MIRTGEQYKNGIRDGREVWIDGERVKDVTQHPALRPIIDLKARMYDMTHEERYAGALTYVDGDERHSIFLRPPRERKDWTDKLAAVDLLMKDIGGVGDETVSEMWSLADSRDVLAEIDPRFAANIDRHIRTVVEKDVFHVSANTDPKGDRSLPPQQQDPDMMVHVARETDAGIVIRGAKYETAAAYADQAYLKPTAGA